MGIRFDRNLLATFFLCAFAAVAAAAQPEQTSADGLQLTPSKNVEMLYTRTGASLAGYKQVAMLEPYVAFRKNWQRDQNDTAIRVTSADMDRIKKNLAEEFQKVFVAELTKAGYTMTDKGGEDVLILRPAIIDLDVAAPDDMSAGMSRTFSTSAGSMTLYLELLDGATGQIIARAADRRNASDMGTMMWQNSVTNKAEADRQLQKWADLLVKALENAHAATGSKPPAAPAAP
jgi:hypothetical protein